MERELVSIFGNGYRLSEPRAAGGAFLPPYVKRRFNFYRLCWRDTEFILAELREPGRGGVVSALPEMARSIEAYYRLPAVLYWRQMSAQQAGILRAEGLGYISAFAGYSIPFLWQYAPHAGVQAKRQSPFLSPCAQALLVRQMVFGDVDGMNVRSLSALMPYSAMLLGKAKDELVQHNLCRYPQGTRAGAFSFSASTASLWEASAHLLTSPVRDSHRVRLEDCRKFLQAGATALSKLTPVGDDALPTYAYYCRKVAERIPQAPLTEAGAVLQLWSYPPEAIVSPGAATVDACSLYLSFKNDQDPRIQLALPQIWNP